MGIPKYGLKKIKFEVEFFNGKKFETRGRYVPQLDSIDLIFKDLDTKKEDIHLEDEQCEELAKFFYSMYKTFKDMQGNEVDTEHIFDMNKYRDNHNKGV